MYILKSSSVSSASCRNILRCSTDMLARPVLASTARRLVLNRTLVRTTTTTALSQDESQALLRDQRRRRPNSPHLTIYQPQLTWYLSMFNRITGLAVSGGLYAFATAYLAAPLFNWHLDTASMAEAFGSLSEYAKFSIKAGIALPFTFHSWNGIRHLMWDTSSQLDLRGGILFVKRSLTP